MKQKDKGDTDFKLSRHQKIRTGENNWIPNVRFNFLGKMQVAQWRWINTKYPLSLEKRHYNKGKISQLKLGNETFVTTDKEI